MRRTLTDCHQSFYTRHGRAPKNSDAAVAPKLMPFLATEEKWLHLNFERLFVA
jgi:hypothetical protein